MSSMVPVIYYPFLGQFCKSFFLNIFMEGGQLFS
jgi:hypothetical protein